MRLRTEYKVSPDLKFVANLDMMHVIERALRRADIPYHLSEGFNPHIRLSMGTVLPVGLWGEKEYFDLELDEMGVSDYSIRMNQALPTGIRINDCRAIKAETLSLMKVINTAEYAFLIKPQDYNLDLLVDEIINQEQILVPNRGKKKGTEKDLRPGLYELAVEPAGQGKVIRALVSVNEPVNVRFDELLDMFGLHGLSRDLIVDFWRRGNYIKRGEQLLSPLEII